MSKKVKGSTSGIYVILCKANGKTRIGQASEIDRRWSQYRAELRGNKFNVKELQEDFNLYAEESFSFKIIERSPQKKLKELENYYILKYNAINYGYNTRLNDLSKPKKIRRGKEAANFSKERSFITGGELNGHCTKLSNKKVFELLDMLIAGIDRITIATKFNINPSYISRIGRDRWVKVYEEWLEHKKETTFVFGDTKAVLLINYPDANIGVSASN